MKSTKQTLKYKETQQTTLRHLDIDRKKLSVQHRIKNITTHTFSNRY